MTNKTPPDVASDFDGIAEALAADPRGDLLSRAERELLACVPAEARTGLDVGCGHGVLTCAIARRGVAMLGVDLSPGMIALARHRAGSDGNIRFETADIMSAQFDEYLRRFERRRFDVVTSVSMVHHLPLQAIVERLASFVGPGGTLLIQDVVTRDRIRDLPLNLAAAASRAIERLRRGRWRDTVAMLYDRHGAHETYLSPADAKREYARLLPGARVIHHLAWRYSVVWRRPSRGDSM